MKLLYFLPFLFISSLTAQNWSPVNLHDVYNYSSDSTGLITHSVWVDSVKREGRDTVFYLNQVVRECDTCIKFSQSWNCEYILINQPQFYQRKMRKKPNGQYVFENPDTLVVNAFAGIGKRWVFSPNLNIGAQLISMDTISFLGVNDSVKYISLFSGDTLLLTKNHGFLSFFDHTSQKKVNLIGLEGGRKLGDQVPQTLDFFDFEVGDEFQYLELEWSAFGSMGFPFGQGLLSLVKKRVTSKVSNGGAIQYSQSAFYRSYEVGTSDFQIPDITQPPTYRYQWPITLTVSLRPGIEPDGFPGQKTESIDYGFELFTACFFQTVSFLPNPTLLAKVYDMALYSEYEDHFTSCDPYDDDDDIWTAQSLPQVTQMYQVGLGKVYISAGHQDGGFASKLIGYIKNGDTTGVVFSDQELLTSLKEIEKNLPFRIFPNPSTGVFSLSFESSSNDVLDLKVYSMTGERVYFNNHPSNVGEIEINLNGNPPGIYSIYVEQNGKYYSQKIVLKP